MDARQWIVIGAMMVGMSPVWADEEPVPTTEPAPSEETVVVDEPPAVLNNPEQSVDLAKQIINRINPSYETVWDMWNGDFYQGVSGTLYSFTSRDIPIASVRLGASTGMSVYSGMSLDLPGISRRFIPTVVKEPATTGPLDEVWAVIGKYARVGLVGGFSFDHHDPLVGITAGAALSF